MLASRFTSSTALGLGLTFSTAFVTHGIIQSGYFSSSSLNSNINQRLLRCDAGSSSSSWLRSDSSHDSGSVRIAQSSSTTKSGSSRRKEAKLYRQISSGSMLGLVAGVALGAFSKPLTMLIGLLLFGIQFAATRGFDLIPYRMLQGYVTKVDVRSALMRNVPFKLSFGLSFAMAAFVPL